MNLPNILTFVDIETTGLSPIRDRIIEIGLLRVKDGKLDKTFQSLINPDLYLSPEITLLTGITVKNLGSAPTFRVIKDELWELLTDALFIAHNARFDYSFIRNEFKRLGLNFSTKHLCSAKLSRNLFPRFKHHNLDSLIERFSIECSNRHRAFDDAKVLWDFWQKAPDVVSQKKWDTVINKLLKKPSLPAKLKWEDLEDLPETPGVYIFYGANNSVLYVGKSINLKERVMSHFAADLRESKEMRISQNIESLEVIQSAGELGALILESQLIKKLKPLFNRMLRDSKGLAVLKQCIDKDGYLGVDIESMTQIELDELEKIVGIFKSVKQAKNYLVGLVKEYNLCDKLVGLENTKSSCFGYGLGRCRGACLKKELSVKYNFRFLEAFTKTKLRSWPFDGPIAIQDEDILENKKDSFIFDKWCFIKKVSSDGESEKDEEGELRFDYDLYKILVRFILNNKNKSKIKVVKANFENTLQLPLSS